MQNDIERSASPSIPKFYSLWRLGLAIWRVVRLGISAGQRHDSRLTHRGDFPGIAYTVRIGVVPQGQVAQFGTGELAVGIVIQRGQRLIAVSPKEPKSDIAEKLQRRCDTAGLFLVIHQPGGIAAEPTPWFAFTGAISVETHAGISVHHVSYV